MILSELITEVYTITKRPDLVDSTTRAIKAATLKLHQVDFWYKDIFETGIAFSSSDYFQQFSYRNLIPLWRSIKYIRKYDAVGQSAGKFFDLVTPKEVVDGSGLSREDIFYIAGAEVDLRSSTSFQYALLGCYVNPDITDIGYNSWIALDHPYAIVYDAASRVFKGMGKDDEAATFKSDITEQIAMITTSNVQPEGY